MTKQKRGLGRGLSALIGEKTLLDDILEEDLTLSKEIKYIDLEKILTKEDQPRKDFSEASLLDLSKSIEEHGVLQPIIVRKLDDKFEIIAGERRYRASKLAKLKEIPALIMDVDNENAAKLALIENVQREDLNPIEEATAYKQLLRDFKLKQEELGQSIGKSRAYISNSLRLLNLEEEVISHLYKGDLTTGHGKVLLGIKDPEEQIKLAKKIIDTGLNVRETEIEAKDVKKGRKKVSKGSKTAKSRDPYLRELEEQLMESLGTKVKLLPGDKIGKIEIEYYGEEDLSRLFDLLSS